MGKNKKKRRYGNAVENAEMRSSGANYGYLKLPEGVRVFNPEIETVAVIDILPYEVTDKNHMDKIEVDTVWYKKPFKIHREVGVENDSVVCPTTFGKPCPICEHQATLREDGDTNEETLKKLNAKYRSLYVVKVRSYDGKKKFDKKEYHLFDFSDHLFQKIFETQLKRKEAFADFFLPDSGKSLEITFDKKSFGEGKPFPIATRIDFVDRKKQYKEDVIDEIPNLDEVLTLLPYEELEAKFHNDDVDTGETSDKKEKKDKKKKNEKIDKIHPYVVKINKIPSEEAITSDTKKDKKEKKGKKSKKDKKEKVKDECPYGHKFGKDCDKFDDCTSCDVWNECKAKKKELKKAKKK